jgi:hypothetical protein
VGLKNWFETFREDLRAQWNQRGKWKDFDELLVLNRHAERLLWRMGIFPWTTTEGAFQIEVPMAFDVQRLPAATVRWHLDRMKQAARRALHKLLPWMDA